MKKTNFFKLAMLVVVCFMGLSGCEKDEDKDTSSGISVEIDGEKWDASVSAAAIVGDVMNITGQNEDGDILTMTLKYDGEGTYNLSVSEQNVTAFNDGGNTSYVSLDYLSETGQVIIDEINNADSTISGSFSFNLYHSMNYSKKEFVNGVIKNVKYTSEVSYNNGGENTFEVDIDGASFIPTGISGVEAYGKITISATDNMASETVGLTIPSDATPGTYSLGSIFSSYTGQYNLNSSTFLTATDGQLIITSHDESSNRIEGTFYFDAEDMFGSTTDTYSLTNGSFAITYN